jgi:hypothetical protein
MASPIPAAHFLLRRKPVAVSSPFAQATSLILQHIMPTGLRRGHNGRQHMRMEFIGFKGEIVGVIEWPRHLATREAL